jgi:hypothetical protein
VIVLTLKIVAVHALIVRMKTAAVAVFNIIQTE